MIIDSIIFGGELDMLEFRLRVLWDRVDRFVIVEADRTHSGKPKPFYFLAETARFEWAKEKIAYMSINIDVFDLNLDSNIPDAHDLSTPFWKIENRQRTAIIDACKYFSDNDILMISDLDEIPSLEAVDFRKANNLTYPMACDQYIIPYSLNYYRPDIGWRGTVMCDLGYARLMGAQNIRDMRQNFSPFAMGGWHLTYFGGAEAICRKIKSYAHQENNREEFTSLDHIGKAISSGGSLFNDQKNNNMRIDPHTFFPGYFLQHTPKEWVK